MELNKIGFYTLTDHRAANASETSPLWRCEMLLTSRCNFRCPYCRGFNSISENCGEYIDFKVASQVLNIWISEGLKNVRFSGGEPLLYPYLLDLIRICKSGGVERIAISSNGSFPIQLYYELISAGANDFSISLDACCSTFGNQMVGVKDKWEIVVKNIAEISKICYVTVGIVVIPETLHTVSNVIKFAHELGVADIRIISAAQFNEIIENLDVSDEILDAHPILKYRIKNFQNGKNVRGITEDDCHICYLVQDDSVVAGKWHFPCVIHMREGGSAIGTVGPNMRKERIEWMKHHNSFNDPICRKNCLDVCKDYCNRVAEFRRMS